ncbi:MAG: hypothetical protein J6V72_19780 [Kiritimatiellae bacterium]|nr:hypothetical protein [Kiritimatiellia bacterium]
MAAHSNNKSILGQGLLWNARSGMLERVIDFAKAGLASTDAYYEIGTLPKGFVPRNIAILQLAKANAASTVKVYKTVEDADSGSATEIASVTTATSGTLGTVFKPFDGIAVEQSSSSPYAVSSAAVTPSMGAQLAVKLGSAFTSGIVKVVISGDRMAGIWDDGDAAPPITPKDAVPVNLQ